MKFFIKYIQKTSKKFLFYEKIFHKIFYVNFLTMPKKNNTQKKKGFLSLFFIFKNRKIEKE